MSPRAVGLILLWGGTLLLVAVLQHRIRRGAWDDSAFDEAPPIERWSVAIAIVGMLMAAVGGALVVWSVS